MLKFWLINGLRMPLFMDPDDGPGMGGDPGDGGDGGDPEHPDFEIPGGVPRGDGGDGNEPPPAGWPAPRAAAGAPAPRGTGGNPPPEETIPKHRLDEVIAQRDGHATKIAQLEEQLKKFQGVITGALGIQNPDAPNQPAPLDARGQAIVDRILQLMPWLKDLQPLAQNADALGKAVTQLPDVERQNKIYWQRVAQQTVTSVQAKLAPLFLGKGKTAADLTPAQVNRFNSDFFEWVKADEKRFQRYENLDEKLVDDYVREVDETVVAPLRRQYGASALERAGRTANLPVAGGAGTPSRTPRPKPQAVDEDQAADAAWKAFQELQGAEV